MDTIEQHIYKYIGLFFIVLVLSACGNVIKQDLVALDQAMYESGMTETAMQQLTTQAQQAQTLTEHMQVAQQLHDTFQHYNRAIEQLDFQSDEVRALRDELSTHNRQLIQSLNDLLQFQSIDQMHLNQEQHQQALYALARNQQQITLAESNIQTTLNKIRALGEENGISWQ